MILTKKLLREAQTPKGGLTWHQIRFLGVPTPPTAGWRKTLMRARVEMSEDEYRHLCALGRGSKEQRRKIAKRGPISPKPPVMCAAFDYPSRRSEAEVAAWLWQELCRLGWKCRMEVQSNGPYGRVDLVVFDDDKQPIRAVEVKAGKATNAFDRHGRPSKALARQVAKYAKCGVPVDIVVGMDSAKAYASKWRCGVGPSMNHYPTNMPWATVASAYSNMAQDASQQEVRRKIRAEQDRAAQERLDAEMNERLAACST